MFSAVLNLQDAHSQSRALHCLGNPTSISTHPLHSHWQTWHNIFFVKDGFCPRRTSLSSAGVSPWLDTEDVAVSPPSLSTMLLPLCFECCVPVWVSAVVTKLQCVLWWADWEDRWYHSTLTDERDCCLDQPTLPPTDSSKTPAKSQSSSYIFTTCRHFELQSCCKVLSVVQSGI